LTKKTSKPNNLYVQEGRCARPGHLRLGSPPHLHAHTHHSSRRTHHHTHRRLAPCTAAALLLLLLRWRQADKAAAALSKLQAEHAKDARVVKTSLAAYRMLYQYGEDAERLAREGRLTDKELEVIEEVR
jgi:hypothetical protein